MLEHLFLVRLALFLFPFPFSFFTFHFVIPVITKLVGLVHFQLCYSSNNEISWFGGGVFWWRGGCRLWVGAGGDG